MRHARLRIGACLSLSGNYAQFGRQALRGLEAWSSLDGTADVLAEDDRSDRRTLEAVLPGVAARCDLLLGPYSTQLMRTAGRVAAESGWLVWNHGGSGDDVEGAHPGHLISVLTPASRYAEPFLQHIASERGPARDLCIVQGTGSFGRQVADGAETIAGQLGIRTVRAAPGDQLPPPGVSREWDLFSAGVFEQDAGTVGKAQRLPVPPRRVCAVAAGVHAVVGTSGPTEDDFLRAYSSNARALPDYPAAQAAAGAVLAVHCARLAGRTSREDLWAAAATLDSSTLFGAFKIDPRSGTQVKHQTVLVRWGQREPVPAG